MGVNDYLIGPIDRQELLARVNTQMRRWRYTEQLRHNVQASMELAVTDALTGLYNRRYMENQMAMLVDNAANRGKMPVDARARRRPLQDRSMTRMATMSATACCRNSPTASRATSAMSTWPAAPAARSSSSCCPTRIGRWPNAWQNVCENR